MTQTVNDNLVLICGKSAAGKSASLRELTHPEDVMYMNCEAGKKLPFKDSKFRQFTITKPTQVFDGFNHASADPKIHTIVIDSLTYLMEMYETNYVINSPNGMKAWQDYAQYFKQLMQQHVAQSTKNVIFTAHVKDELNEAEMVRETMVPIKGSSKANGVESYFSCIIAAKKLPIKKLEKYESDLLTITDEEAMLGFKYVYQTKLTTETVNERLRSPLEMWSNNETFIDNNAQLVLDRLQEYYA